MYASIQSTLHNAWLRPKGKTWKPEDFLGKKKGQTWQEKQSILKTMFTLAASKLPRIEPPPRAE